MRARWLAVIAGVLVVVAASFALWKRPTKRAKPHAPVVPMTQLADGFAAGLEHDPFFDAERDRLRIVAGRDELTTAPLDDASTDERADRLRRIYLLIVNDLEVLGREARADARNGVRREVDRWVAQARAEAKLLHDRGDVPPGFELARFVPNVRFLGAVAWLEEQMAPDAACRAALAECATGPCTYDQIAKQVLAAAPGADEYDAGLAAWDKADYKGAAARFSAHLARTPDDARALTWRGLARLALGDTAHARSDFTAALARTPHDPVALEGSGHAAYRSGDVAAAISAWQRAADQSPDRAPTLRAYIAAAGGPQ